MLNIEDFRDYAHRGAEIKAKEDMLQEVANVLNTVKLKFVDGENYILLSKEGLRAFTIINEVHNNITFPMDDHIANIFSISTAKLYENGLIGMLFGMDVFTDHYLPEGQQFITGLGRIVSEHDINQKESI